MTSMGGGGLYVGNLAMITCEPTTLYPEPEKLIRSAKFPKETARNSLKVTKLRVQG